MHQIQRTFVAVFLSVTLLLVAAGLPVSASNAPTQFTVPDTTFTVDGFASPNALVQVYDDGVLIGTVIADSSGYFTKSFTSMASGLHNFGFQYQDAYGLSSDLITETINVKGKSETARNYFLPPTLEILPPETLEGGIIQFRGSTVPGAVIEIPLDGHGYTIRPTAGPDGRYAISIETKGYASGDHSVEATSFYGGNNSYDTHARTYRVLPLPNGGVINDSGERIPDPPTITSPQMGEDGSPYQTEDEHILVRGVAAPRSQVIIYQDGEPIGSTFANAEGNWFFNIAAWAELHEVRAISCLENVCSDFSNLLQIAFTGDIGRCNEFRFRLNDYRFWGINKHDGVDLTFTNIEGSPPFDLILDWGDSTIEHFNRDDNNNFRLHHVFNHYGQFNGTVTMVDDQECEYTRYFSVDVVPQPSATIWWWWLLLFPAGWFTYLYISWHRKRTS